MATTYTKTLITDEATDNDSPITETLMQDIGQSVNYALDVATNNGANSEQQNMAHHAYYESSWTSISSGANQDFAHGLASTPTIVIVWQSTTSGGFSGLTWFVHTTGDTPDNDSYFSADGTNVNVTNSDPSTTFYYKVVAW